jgi:hypothetical protein
MSGPSSPADLGGRLLLIVIGLVIVGCGLAYCGGRI